MQEDHKCPDCGACMMLLPSVNKKVCVDCNKVFVWNQKSNPPV